MWNKNFVEETVPSFIRSFVTFLEVDRLRFSRVDVSFLQNMEKEETSNPVIFYGIGWRHD